MKEILDNCQVEWDRIRGVLYVHNNETGCTVLRVCGLVPDFESNRRLVPGQMIDIAHPENVTYPK